jgi:Domain of unknown function (DUF4402)
VCFAVLRVKVTTNLFLPNINHVCRMVQRMAKLRSVLPILLACWLLPAGAFAAQDETPIQVEIRTQLDFSRAASAGSGGGQISVDPTSGTRAFEGGVVDLGGSALAGSAIVRGEPGRAVRIDLPLSIRMTGSNGGAIEVSNLRTNLPPNPKLDSFGQLEFSFGGDLQISGNISGTFRGRIPVTAEYE